MPDHRQKSDELHIRKATKFAFKFCIRHPRLPKALKYGTPVVWRYQSGVGDGASRRGAERLALQPEHNTNAGRRVNGGDGPG